MKRLLIILMILLVMFSYNTAITAKAVPSPTAEVYQIETTHPDNNSIGEHSNVKIDSSSISPHTGDHEVILGQSILFLGFCILIFLYIINRRRKP